MRWLRERWMSFWFEPASPTNLGFCRALFFGAFFLYYLPEDFSAWAAVSDAFWMPIRLFTRLHLPVLSSDMLGLLQGLWKVTLLLSCVGLFTRISTAASFILGVYLLGLPHNFGKVHHNDTIVVIIFGIMALSRCGDGWSVDQLIRVGRRRIVALATGRAISEEYTWPVRLVWVVFALIFFGAGVSKVIVSGLEWIVSDNMAIRLVAHNYSHLPLTSWGLYVAQHGWLSRLFGATTLAVELVYPLALVSLAARWILVPGMFVTQAGIFILMGVEFNQFLICNLFWVPWNSLGPRLMAWTRGVRTHALLFDGACGLCQGTVAVIGRLDLLGRVQLYDARRDWPAIETRFPSLDQAACLKDIHVITPDAQVCRGFDAYRALARTLPLGWLALPFLYVPGMRVIGHQAYAAVASRRHESGCSLSPSPLSLQARSDRSDQTGSGDTKDVPAL